VRVARIVKPQLVSAVCDDADQAVMHDKPQISAKKKQAASPASTAHVAKNTQKAPTKMALSQELNQKIRAKGCPQTVRGYWRASPFADVTTPVRADSSRSIKA